MKLLVYACHEGVQESLLREWVDRGHDVYLAEVTTTWNLDRAALPGAVHRELPLRPDVISVGSTQDIGKALWFKLRTLHPGIPIVMTHWWLPSVKRLAGPLYKRSVQVSVCGYGRKYLIEHWGMDSEVMYCPVDGGIFAFQETDPEPKRVVVVGNHFPSRSIMGWEKLVEIMAKVYKKDAEVHFEILGENPEINPDDFPNVSTRALKQNEMPPHQARARCAVFTTTFNLIPHSLLGAMAIGKNVVAFDLESLHEVIEDGKSGYLIPCYDTDAFAERILELTRTLADPEIGKRARQNVLEKCDHRLVAGQYETLFRRLVERR